ncbi:MAG: hypothetical protein E2O68_04740 [Deltaproteobacteria bacterium]|nr:MAG: hypothetical protein E2O68_04740 [Deltaproteobacteria bacterium]
METIEEIPLIEKYKRMYRENPSSKVFAPLADAYRKNGKQNKALVILKEGIKRYPGYILGYLGLSNCYFDLGKYELAYECICPFVKNNRENIKLQKLFAKICERTNRSYEAMETYKFIQFIDPKDEVASKRLVEKIMPPEPSMPEPQGNQADWVAVDFSSEVPAVNLEIIDRLVGVSLRKKDYNKAFEYLDAGLDLDPTNQWAIEMKKDLQEKHQANRDALITTQESPPEIEAKLLKFLHKLRSKATRYKSSR